MWQIASAPINKFDLLQQFGQKLGRTDVALEVEEEFFCDRSLNGSRFNQMAGYTPPSWNEMLDELAKQVQTQKNDVIEKELL